MRKRLAPIKDKRRMDSILLVCALIAISLIVVFPLTAPKVKGQVTHDLGSAAAEDGNLPYDVDGVADGVVHWNQNEDHLITINYVVEPGYTLNIPALNFNGNPATSNEITFQDMGTRIDIQSGGTLITNSNGNPFDKTLFWGAGIVEWEGIFFEQFGGSGNISDCMFAGGGSGVVFSPGSTLLSPGVYQSIWQDMGNYGLQIGGANGALNVANCAFTDTYNSAIGLDIGGVAINIDTCTFTSHDNMTFDRPALRIIDANAYVYNSFFLGNSQPGHQVLIQGDSNGTVFDLCRFENGASGDHLVGVEGSSPLFVDCSFENSGELSVLAYESGAGVPAHPILLNPSGDGSPGQFWDDSFDNSSMNAIGNSNITLQWHMNVLVEDPDGNPVSNSQVNVSTSYGTTSKKTASSPPSPPSEKGWAKGFICTELVQFSASVTNYNPFNISAENNSMIGYVDPEPTMNMSKVIIVTVPFNPIPNLRPIVSWLTTPVGVQTGSVTIQYMLFDPDAYDNGTMSVKVFHSMDNVTFWPCTRTQGGGNNTLNLYSNTTYTFIWNSLWDEGPLYNDTVWIMIVPSDSGGNGTSSKTGSFILDNAPPELLTFPVVNVTNTTAIINWTVDEPANVTVSYGLDGSTTDQVSGIPGATNQSVSLTGLQPGRNYTYIITQTDVYGNKLILDPYYFFTEVHILLYKGWNMISIPPFPPDANIGIVLAPISGQYTAVQWYDPNDQDDPWKHYEVGKPYGNDFSIITSELGFWIHMKNDTVFIPDQEVPPKDYNKNISLVKDWNFIGYPSVTTRNINIALAGVPYDMMQTYDAVSGKWLSYDPGTYSTDTLTEMELGRGYWVHATSDFVWEVNYV